MEFPIAIEYVRSAENTIAEALSRLDSVAIDYEVPAKLARGVPSFACPVSESDRLDARTYWISEQQSDGTIAYVISLYNRKSRPEPTDLENLPLLKSYLDVWPQLIVKDDILKHCNK